MRQSRRRKMKYGLQFVRFTRHSTVIILANSFRLHARIVFQKFHFTYCDILHCNTTVRYLRIELLNISYANEREGKEKERNGEKPEKHSRKSWKKKPEVENALSISSDKITTNGPQPLLLSPPFTWPDATLPIPFACRRLLVCFFSPSFPSETSSVDPGARESSFSERRSGYPSS